MRIISGKFGGRKLVSFEADHIRPTSDRVKGSLFNKLQQEWPGARVLDLFAGTGNLGIEALSWGAVEVTAVEMNPQSLKILQKNKDLLKIGTELKTVKGDVLEFLKKHDEVYDIVLIDPPFTEKMAHQVMEAVGKSRVWSDKSIIVIESSKHERMDAEYGPLKAFDTRNFGDKLLTFFQKGT